MKKIVVIGGGPGGYVAAIRAAQLGAEVYLIEQKAFGGTCLNEGCIPTKALLHTGEMFDAISKGKIPGLKTDRVSIDWEAAQQGKNAIVKQLVNGVGGLLAANKVHVVNGKAKITACDTVTAGAETIKADAIIIATGSESIKINFPGSDLSGVIDSTQALSLEEIPESLAIIGGGVIGVEFASLFQTLGTKVTIIEMLDEILPTVDSEIAQMMYKMLTKKGVVVSTGARLSEVKEADGKLKAFIEAKAGPSEVLAEKILVAVGRKPVTSGLGLEELGIVIDRGAVAVDENFQTNIPGIFAIGDCNAKMMLAHAASAQGEAAVDYILTGHHNYTGDIIPSCVYTHPEIASVGITENGVKARGVEYQAGRFNLAGNGKSIIEGEPAGIIKIIAEKEKGIVLGAHMIGPRATDMISEIAVLMQKIGTVEDLIHTVHPHPTVSEAVREAAMSVFGDPIHWPPSKR